jgi:hypothetical protein
VTRVVVRAAEHLRSSQRILQCLAHETSLGDLALPHTIRDARISAEQCPILGLRAYVASFARSHPHHTRQR